LIEPPPPQPPPVQGHWDNHIGVRQQFAAGTGHPPPHSLGQIETVAVFQTVNQAPGNIIVTCNGATAIEWRRIGDGLGRQRTAAEIVGKGDPEALAIRLFNQMEGGPTLGAERSKAGDGLLAGEAICRQEEVGKTLHGHRSVTAEA
jgi:hypothetical protein